MQVFVFRTFGLKMPIQAPKIGVLGEFDPLNGKPYQPNPQKAHPCPKRRRKTHTASKSVHRSDLCTSLRNQKRQKPDSGKLGVRPDHPRRPIEIPFGMVGGLPAIVIYFKFHQNRSMGFRDMGGRNLPLPIDFCTGF